MSTVGNKNLKAGPGRPKGCENKINRDIKEMIREALDKAGGVKYLVEQAHKRPSVFLALVGRLVTVNVQMRAEINIDIRELVNMPDSELLKLTQSEGSKAA